MNRVRSSNTVMTATFVAVITALAVPIAIWVSPVLAAPPTAAIGGPYSISEGEDLDALDASGSSDPELDPLTYAWDLDNDGAYDDASGVAPDIPWATLEALGLDDDGTYPIGLEVDDGTTATTDSVDLTIINTAPELNATGSGTVDAGASYTLTLSANDPGDDAILEWFIDWGDGITETVPGNPPTRSHTYSRSARTYNILVAARDEDDTHMDHDLAVTGYSADNTWVVAGPDGLTSTALEAGFGLSQPYDVAIGPNGDYYVSGAGDDAVHRYDGTTSNHVGSFAAGTNPIGLVFGPGDLLYVASFDTDEVLLFDTSGTSRGVFVSAGSGGLDGPTGLTFGPGGNLFVSSFNNNAIYEYDGATGAFEREFAAPGSVTPEDLEFGPDGHLYVSDPNSNVVRRFDGTSGAPMGPFTTGMTALGAIGLNFAPDGFLYVDEYYDHTVLRYRANNGAYEDEYMSPGQGGIAGPAYMSFVPIHRVAVGAGDLTVNSTGDSSDAVPGNGFCDTGGTNSAGADECTLRAAIEEANAFPGDGVIEFNMPATESGHSGGVWTITPGATYPDIVQTVSIDATTQPGFSGDPIVQLDGSDPGAAGATAALTLEANDSLIEGFIVHSWGDEGLEIDASTFQGDRNTLRNNWVGIDDDQTLPPQPIGDNGILVTHGANDNTIEGNVVGGATNTGIMIRTAGSDDNIVIGNSIGVAPDGSAIPNGLHGIELHDNVVGNRVGGPGADGNAIVNNDGAGIVIGDEGSDGNLIEGNHIGVNVAGTAMGSNGTDAITIDGGGDDTQIINNLIAHPNGDGIELTGPSTGTVIQGNTIGTNVARSADWSGRFSTISLELGAADTLIGGIGAGEGNLLANAGVQAADPNSITLWSDAGAGVSILGNDIYGSRGIGIDLEPPLGTTANDPGDLDSGPNDLLNHPVIVLAVEIGGVATVTFDLDVPANLDDYRVEFFTNPSGTNVAGNYEGEFFASAVTTAPGTGLTHAFSASAGDVITATATRIDTGTTSGFSSTSEFSAPFTVAGCADSDADGLCDLEEDANSDADADPATNPGPDTDGDTTPNYLDDDDDDDGTPTTSENPDPNGDGDPRDALDDDRDGQPDYLDDPTGASDGTVAAEQKISDTEGGFGAPLVTNDHFGRSAASIGDLDGDGINDVAVGAPFDDDGGSDRGAIYILFLNADGTVKNEQKISDTQGGFAATLDNADQFGIGIAGLGDLDGDGINDIAVGADQDDDGWGNHGAVYVLFLNADGTVKAEQKISDTQGGFGATLGPNDRFGSSVATIGDLDGDGLRDIAVGAKDDDDTNIDSGAVYVLFLNSDGTVKAEQKISNLEGGLGAVLATTDGFGIGVAGIGDLDGDSAGDIAVGAWFDDDGSTNRGAVYVLFLNSDGTVKAKQKISDTAGGFAAVLDNNDSFGTAVGGVGDVDGDGVADLVVGAPRDDDGSSLAGAAFVLFLNANGTVKAEQKISNLEGNLTTTIDGSDQFGYAVAGIGDLDRDGLMNIAVGLYGDDDGGPADRGAVFVLDLATVNHSVAVNSTGDDSDAATGDGICDTGSMVGLDPECTLRAAIEQANVSGVIDTIEFDIPLSDVGHNGGVWTITPAIDLPSIDGTVTIDGTTQTGWTSLPRIELDGSTLAGTVAGLRVNGASIEVRGLAVGGFPDVGISVVGDDATIAATHVGLAADGSTAAGNGPDGILVTGDRVTIGGSDPLDRNVVGHHTSIGIALDGAADAVIHGNYIGVQADGATPAPNGDAIDASGASNLEVGGTGTSEGNVLSGNTSAGITLDTSTDGARLYGNLIGVAADGSTPASNGWIGINNMTGAAGTIIGGRGPGEGNTIAHNGDDGIRVLMSAQLPQIIGNQIHDNTGIGIDIGINGPNPPDPGDVNGHSNQPTLLAARSNGGLTTIDLTFDTAAGDYLIDYYANPGGGDPSGYGEGQQLIATVPVTHDGGGAMLLRHLVPGSGSTITATATRVATPQTTEFSNAIIAADLASTRVTDSSIRRSDLYAAGGVPSFVAGAAGQALDLDGSKDHLVGPGLDITDSALTVAGWVRLDTSTAEHVVVSKRDGSGNVLYELAVDGTTSEATATLRLAGAPVTVRGGVVSTTAWHHLAATWNGTDLVLYVDGAEVDRTATVGALSTDATTRVTVGARDDGTAGTDGRVDNVRVEHVADAAARIAAQQANVANPGIFVTVGDEQTAAPGAWTTSTAQSRSGSYALAAPETPGAGSAAWAVATGIDEPGLVFESWWWMSTASGIDLAAGTRAGPTPTNQYSGAATDAPFGWELRHPSGGGDVVDAGISGTASTGTWVEVEMWTDQLGNSRLLIDGAEVIGWTAQGNTLTSGSAGLLVNELGSGEQWYIDDPRARKLVTPEPITTLGPLDRN